MLNIYNFYKYNDSKNVQIIELFLLIANKLKIILINKIKLFQIIMPSIKYTFKKNNQYIYHIKNKYGEITKDTNKE